MLQVKNLSVSYGAKEILHNISFEVPRNENLVIFGQNGCGKTTLLKAIAGLIPYKGEIYFDGNDISKLNIKDRGKMIAFMSQFTSLEFEYKVEEVVKMGRYPHQTSGLFSSSSKSDWEIVRKVIQSTSLEEIKKSNVKTLSGGQLQRVYFARALAQEPKLLLLDEPTNHLDLKYQAELLNCVIDWSKKEKTMTVGVLHDLNQGLKLGDYGVFLKHGDVVAKGPMKEIITKKQLEQVYDMNIYDYMIETLKKWEDIKDE